MKPNDTFPNISDPYGDMRFRRPQITPPISLLAVYMIKFLSCLRSTIVSSFFSTFSAISCCKIITITINNRTRKEKGRGHKCSYLTSYSSTVLCYQNFSILLFMDIPYRLTFIVSQYSC